METNHTGTYQKRITVTPSLCDASFSLGIAPQFAQKLPLLLAPQEQIQPSGFALPQFGQKLPLTSVPQSHFHPPAAGAA